MINLGSNLRGIIDSRITAWPGVCQHLSAVKLFDFPTHKLIKKIGWTSSSRPSHS